MISATPLVKAPARPPAPRFSAVFLLLAFAVALLLPLAKTDFSNAPRQSATEKRNLALFPKWAWRGQALEAFPADFEAAFNDRFGFRTPLVRWLSRLKVRWGLSVLSKPRVTLGRAGWLYYSETVKQARGLGKARPAEAEAWARYLRGKKEWLGARGIGYLFVIVPNKEWVYPEYLPKGFAPAPAKRFSDQLVARLSREPGLPVLDLRPVLLNAKPLGLIYDRTDTHWSQLGAFLAANRILERLHAGFPDLAPASLEARHPYRETGPGGDLAVMLGLPDELTETRLIIEPQPGAAHRVPPRFSAAWPQGTYFELPAAFESNLPGLRHNLLLVGNSFTEGLLRYLPGHFRRVLRLRPALPYSPWFHERLPGIIDAEKPDLYLEVLSERHLQKAPKNPF